MLVLGSTHSHTLPMNAPPPRNSRDGALQRSIAVVVLGTCKTRSAPQLLQEPVEVRAESVVPTDELDSDASARCHMYDVSVNGVAAGMFR